MIVLLQNINVCCNDIGGLDNTVLIPLVHPNSKLCSTPLGILFHGGGKSISALAIAAQIKGTFLSYVTTY